MKTTTLLLALGAALCFTPSVQAYLVAPAASLEELAAEADVIFKGTCLSTGAVKDDSFPSLTGFRSSATNFKVISVLKGEGPAAGAEAVFHHYEPAPPDKNGWFMSYMPQQYQFTKGRTYLVFAKKTAQGVTLRQVWDHHTGKSDQGALQCASDEPTPAGSLKEVLWLELNLLLKSSDAKDVLYGIRQMDSLSDPQGRKEGDDGSHSSYDHTRDFERSDVLKAIGPLLKHADAEVVQAAITLAGSGNPYLSEERAPYWLNAVGASQITGLGAMDARMPNPGGIMYREELAAIADSTAPATVRALAIRALGLVKHARIAGGMQMWQRDAEAPVRAAATMLQADYPGEAARPHVTARASDPSPEVRRCAAYVVGCLQDTSLLPLLGALLKDGDAGVRRAASESLLSFSPREPEVVALMRAHAETPEFFPLFANALAAQDVPAHLELLAKITESKPSPTNWSGGQVPSFTAWKLLFKHLQGVPGSELKSGRWDRYLSAMENGYVTGSSEPTYIYAFYLKRGMPERARAYREKMKKAVTYDIDLYFKRVDENPSGYEMSY